MYEAVTGEARNMYAVEIYPGCAARTMSLSWPKSAISSAGLSTGLLPLLASNDAAVTLRVALVHLLQLSCGRRCR